MGLYDVVIVRRDERALPASWRHRPVAEMQVATLRAGLERWAALALVRAFNQAECQRPYGVWAIVRRSTGQDALAPATAAVRGRIARPGRR